MSFAAPAGNTDWKLSRNGFSTRNIFPANRRFPSVNNLQITRQEHTNVPPSYAEMESPFWSWKNTVWRLPHFRNRNCAVSICAHSTARNRKSPFFRSSRDSTGPGSRLQTRLMKNCMHGWAIRHIAPGVFLCLTGKIRNDMGKAQRCKELFPDPEPSF